MGVKVQQGDTLFGLAQQLLGDGRATDQLVIDGWDGNPNRLPVGVMARTKFEKAGPPARWSADPSRLGSSAGGRGGEESPEQQQGQVVGIDAAGRPVHDG